MFTKLLTGVNLVNGIAERNVCLCVCGLWPCLLPRCWYECSKEIRGLQDGAKTRLTGKRAEKHADAFLNVYYAKKKGSKC